MPISGIVIQVEVNSQESVKQSLRSLPAVELQAAEQDGVLVAVVDAADFADQEWLTGEIRGLPGVTGLTVSYHNFEDMIQA